MATYWAITGEVDYEPGEILAIVKGDYDYAESKRKEVSLDRNIVDKRYWCRSFDVIGLVMVKTVFIED